MRTNKIFLSISFDSVSSMFLRKAEALLFIGREIIMGNPERANRFNVTVDWLRYDVF